MQIPKRRHRNGAADTDQREIRRKHLALQVPKLMPRKIPSKKKKKQGKIRVWGKVKNKERQIEIEIEGFGVELLEHDDSADEGDPESGAEAGGEAEEVGHLQGSGEIGGISAVGFRSEGFRGKEDSEGEESYCSEESS